VVRTATDRQDQCHDFEPVFKHFTPDAQCTWLLTELDSDDPDRAVGLDDLGQAFPELARQRRRIVT
jgi:hypothetical protein